MALHKKQEFVGAVTLLSFSSDGSLIYVGVGPTVFLYSVSSGELQGQHIVLPRGILHGCDIVRLPRATSESFAGVFFGQKRVSCFTNLPQSCEAAQKIKELVTLGNPKVFSDWVFDAHLLTDDLGTSGKKKNLLVAVGLAHNLVQIWDPTSRDVLLSVQCTERCILYALAFYGRSLDELIVASGTVYQHILLWNPMDYGLENTDTAVAPVQRLHAHEGVLFKLAWSSDAHFLASVSDDRTVQLWSNNRNAKVEQLHMSRISSRAELLQSAYLPVFRAWGHSARIWDVTFWQCGVVTASEDGFAKLWNLNGHCVATLRGHVGRHVWRVAVHPSQELIVTGGGDGAVKLWNVARQLMSSFDAPETSEVCRTIRVPIISTEKKGGPSSYSVRNIVLSTVDDGETAFVASERGEIFCLNLISLTAKLAFVVPPSGSDFIQTRTGGLSAFSIDFSGRFLLLGEVTGRVCIVEASTGNLLHAWTSQANTRVMKIWWDQEDALFISSAGGALVEWKPVIRQACNDMASVSVAISLVAVYKIPTQSSISSILVVDRSAKVRNIVGGDGHGNVYLFHRPYAPSSIDYDVDAAKSPAHMLKSVHGRELVASLLLSNAQNCHLTMLSGGHDGHICSYALEDDTRSSGALTIEQLGRESIKGISTVKQLWWRQMASTDGVPQHDLMVFGFQASCAILYNASAQYCIFEVECGGWRRPHALYTRGDGCQHAVPSHTLVFTPRTTEKQHVDIKVHSTLLDAHDSSGTSSFFSRCSLHDHHHSRMTTCVSFLGKERLVTAAEDNSLMLHRRRRTQHDHEKHEHLRWCGVASGIAHTTIVRALTTYPRIKIDGVEEHIVLSGGGKQRLNVWLVSGDDNLLRHICGQERAGAAQDHRILGLTTFPIPRNSENYRLVTACNSEGSTQLLLLDVNNAGLFELGDCHSASRKPILSCVGFQEGEADAMIAGLAVGSTDGLVTLWDLTLLLQKIGSLLVRSHSDVEQLREKLEPLISELRPSGNYLAHDMGTNCMDLVSCARSAEEGSLDVTIVSGGDDQNLNLHQLRFPSCQLLSKTRMVNASGSAIKAVSCVNAQVIFAAGYDQRVSKWNIQRNENGFELEWQGAAFSECADIADLAVRQALAGTADDVVVVGQGLQMLQFQRGEEHRH
uniref:WD repeat-containing protein 6 n=1 Tax=Peronospora matthiolae TaxID=2874970 RepID=A0AAV1VMB2_9STRA